MTTVLLVLLGGALGAVLRHLVAVRLPTTGFPRGTLLVNAAGSLLVGAAAAAAGDQEATTALVVTGVCGALTTFSTFALEVTRLAESGARRLAVAYAVVSVAVALAACAGGFAVGALARG